jgi:hypothetical protein
MYECYMLEYRVLVNMCSSQPYTLQVPTSYYTVPGSVLCIMPHNA